MNEVLMAPTVDFSSANTFKIIVIYPEAAIRHEKSKKKTILGRE